ncbi:MerR family transcriptional regulator [Cetobacterium sp.]|uniref:helix-turn-helix domain-containing protein n=1 Tax=Cetobacterium sp. TaxID=2071632 RepID=UPI003F31338A
MYSIGEFARRIGTTAQTLRNWDRMGKLVPARITKGGTRYYSEEQLEEYLKLRNFKDSNFFPAVFKKERKGFSIYFPDIEGAFTCGNDEIQSFLMAMECLSICEEQVLEVKKKKDIKKIPLEKGEYIRYIPFKKDYIMPLSQFEQEERDDLLKYLEEENIGQLQEEE